MSEGTRKLGGIRNALRRWANRLFHRSDKRRSNHSTSDQPLNKTSHPPQDTSPLGNGANPNWPLTTDSHQPDTLDARTSSTRENQAGKGTFPPANESGSNNQPQSLKRNPQGAQQGYLKPALKRKAVNETPSQGPSQGPPQDSSHDYISESPYRYLSLEDSSIRGKKANAQISDEQADGPIASGSNTNNDGIGHQEHQEHYTDHTIHPRPAVVHEEIAPHVHTIYEPTRTRSFHLHEHRTLIQPIVDPAAR
ncbi:hypothetical protein HDV63DRAFT_112804 [Trichoderma sp. SZMC 28014]